MGGGKVKGRGDRDRKDSGNPGSNHKALYMHAFCHNIMRLTCQYLALLPSSTTKMLMLNPLKVFILFVLSLIYRLLPVE